MENLFPLADRLRPASLAEYIGQEHLVGEGKILPSLIGSRTLSSLIFWGPPGTGKTTLSRIIVREMDLPAVEFSATISKINDIRVVMQQAAEVRKESHKPLVVFVDEIHHFNRSIQDAFLPYVERGDIILLGTTTENPAFKINRALLSRIKILEFQPLETRHLEKILQRALEEATKSAGSEAVPELTLPVRDILLHYCSGDARRLLNLLEILIHLHRKNQVIDEPKVREIIQRNTGAYDRTGDDRYQLISAFHKAVRNSDVDASLFWLYRMMEGGEDPMFILRRMIRITAEDIGLADPEALRMVLEAKSAFETLGQPEGDIFLCMAAVYLASAPKSNALYVTEKKMKKLADQYKLAGIPLHIINPSDTVAVQRGAGQGYLYAHDCPEKTTAMKTLPDAVSERDFFKPGVMGFEKKIRERMDYWLAIKKRLAEKPD